MSRCSSVDVAFGLGVRRFRRFADMTQAGLGARVGLHGTTIAKIEKGRRPATLSEAVAISAALRVDVVELVGRLDG